MEFLVSTSYRTTGKSVIWRLDAHSLRLDLFREDQYYEPSQIEEYHLQNPNVGFKDYIYFGMATYEERVYCVGGNVLSVLDVNGNILARRDVDFLRDAHDLQIIDGKVFCTNTGHDRVEIFSTDLEHKDTVHLKNLPCFRDRKLLRKSEHSPDSLHANFLSSRKGNVFVTHSFTCEQNRRRAMILAAIGKLGEHIGWEPSRNNGVVVNRRSGKVLSSGGVITMTGDRVLSGLDGAHDGMFYGGEFYANATHNIETLVYDEDFRLVQRIEFDVGVLLRGLHPISETILLVGATRIDPSRTAASIYDRVLRARGNLQYEKSSSVKIVDRKAGKVLESIYFDTFEGSHPEIYEIIPFPYSLLAEAP